eukprot:GCRY01001211.1.p1 GENE.GCRY01001211.1~~GCRY01001211.1.p1  ORF type:complete len:241 (+),score=59.68 GCRY01001211.1:141-863(+)
MDHREEQQEEVEALQAIYLEEFEEISTYPFQFSIDIFPSEFDAETEIEQPSLQLFFELPASYPEEKPIIEIKKAVNLQEFHTDTIQEKIDQLCEESLGTQVTFIIVQEIKEFLDQTVEELIEDIKKREEEEKEQLLLAEQIRKQKEWEEYEKRLGTPVTVENFTEWKIKFEEERAKAASEKAEQESKDGKLTGKEWFLRNKARVTGTEGLDEAASNLYLDDDDDDISDSDYSSEESESDD